MVDELSFVHEPSHSYGESSTGNAIIQGDNLAVLRALAGAIPSRIRCIYIDPPYNNQEQYTHYVDDLDHSTWLDGISARIEYFRELLRDDGSLWISIDDREVHYLKVALDKILGRQNFITTVI